MIRMTLHGRKSEQPYRSAAVLRCCSTKIEKRLRLQAIGAHTKMDMKITRFEDIEAWKAARKLAQSVSQSTRIRNRFPDRDLMRQIRRCTISVMANIVEGYDSGTRAEFVRFLRIALRSGSELQSHLYVALDEHYLDLRAFEALYSDVRIVKSLIGGFIRYLRRTC